MSGTLSPVKREAIKAGFGRSLDDLVVRYPPRRQWAPRSKPRGKRNDGRLGKLRQSAAHRISSVTVTLNADSDARRNFLASVIACPACGEPLRTDDRNRCSSCLAPYNRVDNAFVFVRSEDEYVSRLSTTTATNPYTTKAKDLIARFKDQWLLDYGSGNPSPDELYDNVIRFDVLHYQSVDVVSSYPRLPFQDNTFDHIVSESVFEHLSDPFYAADELWRVLKPGGWILIDTAFFSPSMGTPTIISI